MKKIIAMLLTAAISVSLMACGGSGSGSGSSGSSETASETTSEALSDGKLIVGTNAEFPPFEYLGDDGNPDGFDIALIKAIGEKLGAEVEIQNMEFGSLITSIGSKIDVSIAGMTITEERKNAVDFSDPYYDAVQFVLLPTDSTVAAKADLLGKNIGCQLGTTGEYLIDDLIAEDGATQKKSYNKAVDAVNDLLNGRVDAVIIDKNPAQVFAENYSDQIKLTDGADFGFEAEQYAIALPKGDTALAEQINKALSEIKADGTFDSLVKQYIEN